MDTLEENVMNKYNLSSINSIEDPVLCWCIDKEIFTETYGSIFHPKFFLVNPINTTELRFKDDKMRERFYKLALKLKLCPSFEEVSTGE
jgi:hypothetical protein